MPDPHGTPNQGTPQRSRHHYEFAHFAVRKACETNPLAFFGVMASEEQQNLLESIWDQVCKRCDETGQSPFNMDDVGIATGRLKDKPVIVIVMPPPAEVAEAHLAAIVLHVNLEGEDVPDPLEFDYWTLEKGVTMDGADRTVLCRWTKDDKHVNLGDGPPANVDQFLACVENAL
jgi:hypothetical protein